MGGITEAITFDDITEAFRNEERSKDLGGLRPDFYPALRLYLDALRKECADEIRANPSSVKVASISSEIKKITQKSQMVFQLRMKKISLMALRESMGGKVEKARMTEEERVLYEALVLSISRCKATALEGAPPGPKEAHSVCALVADESRKVEEQIFPEIQGEEPKRSPPMPAAKKEEAVNALIFIRVLEDLPQIAGGDKTFNLKKDDVANVPAPIGCALVKAGKAVEIMAPQRA
jgi:DNA replication initiation complex subunit (GINS family)